MTNEEDMYKKAIKYGAFTVSDSGAKKIDMIKLLNIKEWRKHIESILERLK